MDMHGFVVCRNPLARDVSLFLMENVWGCQLFMWERKECGTEVSIAVKISTITDIWLLLCVRACVCVCGGRPRMKQIEHNPFLWPPRHNSFSFIDLSSLAFFDQCFPTDCLTSLVHGKWLPILLFAWQWTDIGPNFRGSWNSFHLNILS